MPKSAVRTQPASRASFRYPNFRFYMAARFLTIISSEMQSVAVGWQIYALTRRPLDLGLAGLAQFLPGICLFLLAGNIADRLPRRRIVQTCYLLFSVCSLLLLSLTALGVSTPLPIYAALLFNGAIRAFNAPASQAFVPTLVSKEDFPNAVAWSSSIFQTATVAGPMIGGLLYGFFDSPLLVYSTAACAYFSAFLLLTRLRLAAPVRTDSTDVAPTKLVLEGFQFITRHKLILGAISLDLFAVLLGGSVALLPVFSREILKIGATGLGVLRSAPGVGAVVMGVIVAHWPLRRRAGSVMLWCVFAFGLFTIVFGLSHNFLLSTLLLFLIGASDTISVIIRHTLIQLSTPDQMRGRVSAVNTVFIGASNEVGQFESGLTAQWFGAVPAVVLGGVGTILIVAFWAWRFPSLRKLNELIPSPPTAAEEPARDAAGQSV